MKYVSPTTEPPGELQHQAARAVLMPERIPVPPRGAAPPRGPISLHNETRGWPWRGSQVECRRGTRREQTLFDSRRSRMSASIDGTAIDKVLRDAVDSGGVPHVAAIAADRDGVIYQGAAGPREAGQSDPVTVDTLFRIMSMTKMPCTVAALQQVEQGNLDLDAPVADYCPEFAEVQVLTGFDGDTPRLRPPARQATVKNLITHTTGLGYWFWSEDLVQLGEGHRRAERGGGIARVLHRADAGGPGRGVHLRHQHRLAGQGRRGGHRRRPGRGDQAGHHRAARHGPDHVPDDR